MMKVIQNEIETTDQSQMWMEWILLKFYVIFGNPPYRVSNSNPIVSIRILLYQHWQIKSKT